jgi:hypothetical protein
VKRGLHVRVAVHLARLHELDGLVDARLRHGVGGLGEPAENGTICLFVKCLMLVLGSFGLSIVTLFGSYVLCTYCGIVFVARR